MIDTAFRFRVSHAGGKPILRFDRVRTPGIPSDDVAFWSRFRSLTDAHSRYREIERDVLQAIAGECAVVAGAAAS
jgi:hypothetical protein